MKQNGTLFLDLRGAEQEYPLSRRKFQQLIKEKRLKAFRLDGKIILNRRDIEQALTAVPIGAEVDENAGQVVA